MLQLSRQSWNSEKAELFKKIEPYLTFIYTTIRKKRSWFGNSELREVNQNEKQGTNKGKKRRGKSNERLSQLEARFEELIVSQDKQRKLDREFELETDPEIKDQKFDKMLAATRQTSKTRSELEKTVKGQLENK